MRLSSSAAAASACTPKAPGPTEMSNVLQRVEVPRLVSARQAPEELARRGGEAAAARPRRALVLPAHVGAPRPRPASRVVVGAFALGRAVFGFFDSTRPERTEGSPESGARPCKPILARRHPHMTGRLRSNFEPRESPRRPPSKHVSKRWISSSISLSVEDTATRPLGGLAGTPRTTASGSQRRRSAPRRRAARANAAPHRPESVLYVPNL